MAKALNIVKEERALIVLSHLANRKPAFIYSSIEWLGIVTARAILKSHYREIIVLRDRYLEYSSFCEAINFLGLKKDIKAIDVIINMHGGRRYLVFGENKMMSYDKLSFSTEAKEKLRLLYSTACYAVTGNNYMLDVGFRVVIGAKGINMNALTEYALFLAAWAKDNTVFSAYNKSKTALDSITDSIGRGFNENVDSVKVIEGDLSARISEG